MKPIGQRFLVVYAGVLTAVFAVTVLGGLAHAPRSLALEQLDVQRINVREGNGTLRLAISGADRAPGIVVKGREYPHPDRRTAGMIFYNDEGTENGGLSFGGDRDKDGTPRSQGHLSFDAYEQDQTLALGSDQAGARRRARLQFNDYPDYPILEELQMLAAVRDLPPAQRQARMDAFFAAHGRATTRLLLGRGAGPDGDDSVMLALNDVQGRPRAVLKVAADGSPSLQLFDEAGRVVGELAPKR
jgi:hypothetical protein